MIPFIDISSQALLIFGIVISWVGMRSVAGFVWIILFSVAVCKMAGDSEAFGFYGVIYILCAMISVFCQLTDLKENFISSLKRDFFSASEDVREEIDSANTILKNTAEKAAQATKSIIAGH